MTPSLLFHFSTPSLGHSWQNNKTEFNLCVLTAANSLNFTNIIFFWDLFNSLLNYGFCLLSLSSCHHQGEIVHPLKIKFHDFEDTRSFPSCKWHCDKVPYNSLEDFTSLFPLKKKKRFFLQNWANYDNLIHLVISK